MSRSEHAEQPPPSRVRFLVLGWFCLLATLAYVHRGCVAVPTGAIMNDLEMDKDTLAQVMSAFFLGYTVFQLPSGWAGDRWGTRLVLSLCVVLWSAATGWMALANTAMGMWLARLVNGVAQAGIFPCCVKSISRWFPEAEKAFPNGMLGSFMSVGAVIATALTGVLLWYMDWHEAFFWLSLPGLIIAVGFFWWFRDDPAQHSQVNAKELALIRAGKQEAEKTAHATGRSVWPILLGGPMLLVYTQQFCRAAGYIFYLTWFPTFLQQTRGESVPNSGLWASVPLLGVVLGCASGGYLLDLIYRLTGSKQLSRQSVALGSLTACGALSCAAYFATNTLGTVSLLAVGSFCAGLAAPAAYTITIDLGGRHVATVFSTMNMMGNLGAFLMPMVVAELVDWYTWNEALLLLAGLYLTAACCWVMVRIEPPAGPASSAPPESSEQIQVLHATVTGIQPAERPSENIKKLE